MKAWDKQKGFLLSELIKSKGKTITQLALEVGVSRSLLYQVTKGFRDLTKVNLIKIAAKLEMSEQLMFKLLEGENMSGNIRQEQEDKEREFWDRMNFHHFDQLIKDPLVATIRNPGENNFTPLHVIASYGFLGVLEHPEFTRVTNSKGDTPLHWFCDLGIHRIKEKDTELLAHIIQVLKKIPEFKTLKNSEGDTPEKILMSWSFAKDFYKE